MAVTLVEEAYTSQTCTSTMPDGAACMHCYKPKGRVYRCPVCVGSQRIGMAWDVPTCSLSIIQVSRGMSFLPKKSIVT
ncbi:MAG TPA: hypothetical protein VKT82_25040 [Ktedonobacterales bacterium]|nr:hypothetical protein [Ktedonobacterales bacterium]